MILAVAVPENCELVIYGADTLAEQNAFLGEVEKTAPTLIQDTDFSRFFSDPGLAKFKHPPTILEFPTTADLDGFVAQHEIKLTTFEDGHGRQRRMIERHEFNKDDKRTVGEITGYNDFDPFDRRTDEEKQKEREAREAIKTGKKKDAKGKGEHTEDSFGHKSEGYRPEADENGDMIPPSEDKQKSRIRIRDIELETNPDGSIKIGPDGVPVIKRAVVEKDFMSAEFWHLTVYRNGQVDNQLQTYVDLTDLAGMGETNYDIGWDFFAHEEGGIVIMLGGAAILRLNAAMRDLNIEKVTDVTGSGVEATLTPMLDEHEDIDPNDPMRIAYDDLIDVYFRVDVEGLTVEDVNEVIGLFKGMTAFKSNDLPDMSWHAYVRRSDAEATIDLLGGQGITATLVEVDKNGLRYIEEGAGASVIDQAAEDEEPPMPWNDRAAEFNALTEEEQKKALKKIGRFLIYSLKDYGQPTHILVHIQPRSYFKKHEELYRGDFPIEHLLTENFVKYGELPGLYRVNSLDANTTDFLLGNKAGMKESLELRMFLNMADSSAFA